jgi:hypothetical protein
MPELRPLQDEIPPGFWEEHHTAILASGIGLLIGAAIILWWLRRPKLILPLPPEVVARTALDQLKNQPENGLLLSKVSQILRRYLIVAFALAPVESTTTEFCHSLLGNADVGEALARTIAEFLKRCDERKFAPPTPGPPLEAVSGCLQLIEAGEARRKELRAAEVQAETAARLSATE